MQVILAGPTIADKGEVAWSGSGKCSSGNRADRVLGRGVACGRALSIFRHGPGWSDDHGWQSDDGIIAQGGHGFQRHVPGALDGPFVVPFEEDSPDEPDDRRVVGKDADDVGPALASHLSMAPRFSQKWRRKFPQSGGLAISRGR